MKQKNSKTNPEWKGYTLEEIVQRRHINQVKQGLVAEQLLMVYNGTSSTGSQAHPGLLPRIKDIITYASYALRAYRIYRRLHSLFSR